MEVACISFSISVERAWGPKTKEDGKRWGKGREGGKKTLRREGGKEEREEVRGENIKNAERRGPRRSYPVGAR